MSPVSNQTKSEVAQIEVEQLLDRATAAARELSAYTTAQVEAIVQEMSRDGEQNAEFYAEWLVRETGYGNVKDNIKKNLDCSVGLLQRYRPAHFIEPAIDREQKIVSFPKPAGILVALIPSTNPVMTVYYKAIVSLMTRNTVIFSPHPAVKECSLHVVKSMAAAAERAGAPAGAIQAIEHPGIDALDYLMTSPRASAILATGGANRVRAAYRSGNPAFGMGPGNVPCFVHQSAEIAVAAEQIIASNSFDHALPCVCESTILAERSISDPLKAALSTAGGYFVVGEAESKLRAYLFSETGMKPEALGKSAIWIAQQAGFPVPDGTKSLLVEIDSVGAGEPLSREKLFPVMGYIAVEGIQAAIALAQAMLETVGKGHSAAIHSRDPAIVARYAAALPVCRIAVNTQAVEGSSGVSTNLTRGPVIGTGFFGSSSIADNVGPQHLIQWSRAAYPTDSDVPMGEMEAAIAQLRSPTERG